MKTIRFSIVPWMFLIALIAMPARGQQAKKPFTVADDIELTLFGTPEGYPAEVHFSPDGNYVVVFSERGRLELNRIEDSLRFYRTQDIKEFLERSEGAPVPSPAWVITRATYREGRSISDWRWLLDSGGVAFLERTPSGNRRLVLADMWKKRVRPLTSEMEDVRGFDLRDRQHYMYTLADATGWKKWQAELQRPATVGTGRPIDLLLFPDDPAAARMFTLNAHNRSFAVIAGRRFEVKHSGVLSPNGRSIIASIPVSDVPQSWESLYPSPSYHPFSEYRIHAGSHDTEREMPWVAVHQYAQIDLSTGAVKQLTDAPNSEDAGWFTGGGHPSWSSDGRTILLPHTFIKSKDNVPSRPCVAVVDVSSSTVSCVEILKARTGEAAVEEGYHHIDDVRFIGGDGTWVIVTFREQEDNSPGYTEYRRIADGTWTIVKQVKGEPQYGHEGLKITTKEGLNEPPQLIATTKETSRVIWDPNPQLKNFDLGEASVFTWKDKEGREWEGGLYKPVGYTLGKRYPLVIQTHGFSKSEFRPSGSFPTANAAREFAAVGIMVLQIANGKQDCPEGSGEAPCGVAMAESAATKLVSDGLADPENVGIIGFSRTCFQVMEILGNGSLHLKAASMTDGLMYDYFQYLTSVDFAGNVILEDANSINGGPPFGEGLKKWLKRSPGFNLDRVNTPLLVVGEGRISMFSMLQPYAGLRALHKPAELVMLNTGEHVLTNPAMRMASQGGSVDWFRFWLQGYEDPDPAKAEQYKRWREFREQQAQNEHNNSGVISSRQ